MLLQLLLAWMKRADASIVHSQLDNDAGMYSSTSILYLQYCTLKRICMRSASDQR